MKGLMSIIEVLITGMILFVAFLHFFPQYVIRTRWDGVLLHVKVMDTLNTIDGLNKIYEFTTLSGKFNEFMNSAFKPEATGGVIIWWKQVEPEQFRVEQGVVNEPIPYFTRGYKESIVDVVDEVVVFKDDFDDGNADGWTVVDGTWYVEDKKYFGKDTTATLHAVSITDVQTAENIIIEVDHNETGENCYALIIFDYQGPSDFKYAGIHYDFPDAYYVIGSYYGSFNNDRYEPASISKKEIYRLKVKITDSVTVKLYFDDVEKTSWTFPSMGSGKIGLGGGINSETYFDNFIVKELGKYNVYSFTLGLGYPF